MCRKKGDAAALFKTDKAERAKNKNGTTTLWVVSQVTTYHMLGLPKYRSGIYK